MFSSVDYFGPDGEFWELWRPGEPHGPFLLVDGLQGLHGGVDVSDEDGVLGALRCAVSPAPGLDLEATVNAFRRSFVPHKGDKRFGVLRVCTPRVVPVELRVRLSEVLPNVPSDLLEGQILESMEVPLKAVGRFWLGAVESDSGVVVVSNRGESALPVSFRWSGSGGRVELPSGAACQLPPVDGERVFHLDDEESCAVFDTDGVVDYAAMRAIGGVMPELVPVDAERVFKAPPGVVVEWRQRFLTPWR